MVLEQSSDTAAFDLPVEGMTCASCAARIEKGLGAVPGVRTAAVNFGTRHATVTADPGLVDRSDLERAVADLGYRVAADPEAVPEDAELAAIRPRLVVAATLTAPLVVLSMVSALHFTGWEWLAWALATPVVLWAGYSFHRTTVVNLRHAAVTMDTLISVGTLAAYIWSVVALLALDDAEMYFEVGAVVVTLILLGRFFEARARRRAGDALRSLLELGAKYARLESGEEVPVESLVVGDRFVVRPGERIATDGTVAGGASAVDVSMLTGEPVPADVEPGDEVFGGSLNTSGRLVVQATRVGADTALAQVARLVQETQGSKAPVQRLADRVSAVFVPVVIVISALTLTGWVVSGASAQDAITAAVAVLIIACPCALGLATPTAIMVGSGRGAQLGIVIRGGEVLERTQAIDAVLLDKTGTITEGRLELVDLVAPDASADNLLRLAGSVEDASEHPVARAITHAARERGLALVTPSSFENLPGRGVRARVDEHEVLVGRADLFATVPRVLRAAADEAAANGRTTVLVGWDDLAHGVLVLADRVKPTSVEAVHRLRDLGLDVVMVTGDRPEPADAVARAVGIRDVVAETLPDQKIEVVRSLQESGRVVAVVGDGVNDSPALAGADLGIAIGTGTDVAIEASDLTIVSGDLLAAVDAIRLSRRTLATIKGNLFWAFAYNVAAIPLAAAGMLDPMIAAAAMAFSSVFVVSNSLRLRRFRSVRDDHPT